MSLAAGTVDRVAWRRHTVIQGQRKIVVRDDVVLSAVLGSCVAACLWDAAARVGGMNHFLLPYVRARSERADDLSGGAHAMELLVEDVLEAGAHRQRLRAKLFGGAWLRAGLPDVGERNADFAERFLAAQSIAVVSASLRGDRGRRLQFWPMSGRARMILLQREGELPSPQTRGRDGSGDLELF